MSSFLIIFFLLGLIVGSFLNVVILRYNTGRSLAGRSGCFSCNHQLTWYELVPVISFLIQRGRCRHCGSKISRQYPLVELATGLLFALAVWRFFADPLAIVFYCVILSILVVIVAYDFKHKIIPDGLAYLFIILAVISPAIFSWRHLLSARLGEQIIANIGVGLVIFLFFFALWYFSGGRAMGFGDAKLGFGLGALLGFFGALNALILSFWIGAGFGLLLVLLSQLKKIHWWRWRFSFKSELPFAPFLILGLLLNLFFGWSVLPLF